MKQAAAHPKSPTVSGLSRGLVQPALFNLDDPTLCPQVAILFEAVDQMASHADAESRGAVYTRAEVVDFILDLVGFPRFARYVEARKDVIAARHCARKTPSAWYRTLDRIHPELTFRPKLLIPDIKGSAHIVYDAGAFYPHHNLYYVLFSLMSDMAGLGTFIATLAGHIAAEAARR